MFRARTIRALGTALALLWGPGPGLAVAAPRIFFPAEMPEGRQEDLRRLLSNAYESISPLGDTPDEPPILVAWADNDDEFRRLLRMPSEHIIAAAQAEDRRIIINGPAFDLADPRSRQVTITHEYAHLFLGMHCAERLPLWLEEGLAMILSGDAERASDLRLALARAFNRLPPLADLRHSFPAESGQRDLAYGLAYAVTAYYANRQFPASGASGLVRRLIDAKSGPALIEFLWGSEFTRGLQASWSRSFRGFSGWMLFLTSASVIWTLVTVLFLAAYVRRRARRKAVFEEWDEEDAWMESLPEDHWGSPDDS